jgi:Holliday junction resolvasome RuvABC endonuclease subunit
MILGLDVSTTSTGWAIISEDGSFVEMGSFKLVKHDNLFDKAAAVRVGLAELKEKYNVSKISIEEPLQGFRRGMSSAHTLLTLARFNGIISWQAYVVFGFEPIFISCTAARKDLSIKIDKSRDTKDQVMEWVECVTGTQLQRRVAKVGKKKGQTLFAAGVNDAADAYVMARAAHLQKP